MPITYSGFFVVAVAGDPSLDQREWLDSEGFFIFGKHNGEDVNRVAESNPGYLRWILDDVANIADEDIGVIRAALEYSR
jgi:hypothetical protein